MKHSQKLIALFAGLAAFSAAGQNVVPSSGNVGIGTTTPSEKLQVHGKMRVDSSLTVMDSVIFQSTLRVEEGGFIEGDLEVHGNALFHGNATIEGNLNLTNTPPAANDDEIIMIGGAGELRKLDLAAFSENMHKIPCRTDVNGNSIPTWQSVPGNPIGYLFTGNNCPAHVGIGISNPAFELQVVGDAHVSSSLMVGNFNNDPTLAGLSVLQAPTLSKPLLLLGNYDPSTQTTEKKFLVTNTGLVYATEIKVRTTQNFPDYVFGNDYNLMSLDSLDSFIKTEGHLPNMPTAQQVQKDGLGLGQMNILLVEKVEELTLYTIEQQKLIESLMIELTALKSTVESKTQPNAGQ